jgi:hypothetical protein
VRRLGALLIGRILFVFALILLWLADQTEWIAQWFVELAEKFRPRSEPPVSSERNRDPDHRQDWL